MFKFTFRNYKRAGERVLSGIKILHTSNLCLDHVLTDYHKGVRKVKRSELLESFDFIIDKSIELSVNALVIAGGIISAASASHTTLDRVRDGFDRLLQRGIHVVAVPGDSDETSDIGIVKSLFSKEGMCLFTDEKWDVYTAIDGVNIYGIRSTLNRRRDNCLKDLRASSDKVNIGLLYGTFCGTPICAEKVSPVSSQDLTQSNLDYLALGHYENVVNCSMGRNICWYSGSPAHHGLDTFGERHVLLVSFKGKEAKVSPVKVPSRLQRVIHMDLNGKDVDQISHHIERMANPQMCLRLELDGTWSPTNVQLMKELDDMFSDRFFHFEVCDKTSFAFDEGVLSPKKNEKICKNRNASAMRKDAAQSLHEMFIGKVRCTDKTAIYDDRDEADTEETDFADEHLVRVMASKFGLTALGEVYEHENRKALGVS